MKKRKDIHFEVSERKVLLRLFDFLFVLFSLYFVGVIFQFDYFNISAGNFYFFGIFYLLENGFDRYPVIPSNCDSNCKHRKKAQEAYKEATGEDG